MKMRRDYAFIMIGIICLYATYWALSLNRRLNNTQSLINDLQHSLLEMKVKYDEEIHAIRAMSVVDAEDHIARHHNTAIVATPTLETDTPNPKPKKGFSAANTFRSGKANLTLLYQYYGLSDDVGENNPAWYRHMDNSKVFDVLDKVSWNPDGTLTKPKRQNERVWDKKEDNNYFKGYKYPSPHPCPGEPLECGGRGVCDYKRGVCICHPPWTGWTCSHKMKDPGPAAPARSPIHTITQDTCQDQYVNDTRVEKWDKRTVDRCARNNESNGMWLGLSSKMSETIALSIANVLGVKPGDVVLDVGMGCGNLAKAIANKFNGKVNMVGIDYSKEAVNFVRKSMLPPPHVMCVADVRNLKFLPDNSVDHIYENGVFSVTREGHCDSYSQLVRALRPGGTFLIHQTYHDNHLVKCWQNISMQSVERCLAKLGVRMEYILTRDLTEGQYDTYCAGETYAALFRKAL